MTWRCRAGKGQTHRQAPLRASSSGDWGEDRPRQAFLLHER